MSRLTSDRRAARRLREAKAEIRRVERALAERKRMPEPGYDDLADPIFIILMLVAVATIVLDVRGVIDSNAAVDWLRGVVAAAWSAL